MLDDELIKRGGSLFTSVVSSSIPTALLQAELQRRQGDDARPACGSDEKGSYNTPAHVFALVLILVLSTAACGFPLISKHSSEHKGPNKFIFISQHFGTGVLIATAFVHLLPTAFTSLTDPCLGGIWAYYNPMAGLFAMISALAVVGIEMLLRSRGVGHSHSHGDSWVPISASDACGTQDHERSGPTQTNRRELGKLTAGGRVESIAFHDLDESSQRLVDGASSYSEVSPRENGNAKSSNETDDDKDSDLDLDLEELDPTSTTSPTASMPRPTSPEHKDRKKLMLQCLMLEAGILFHSVFIGMAISVATGSAFIVFLIAIAFHQSFEGVALGSRIANISFPISSPRPWLMVLAYGMTTPIGQAIGLIVHNLYDPRSKAGLLMVGIMNAISSGLLLFAGLVQLLAEDFLTDKSYEVLSGRRRIQAFTAVCSGALLMALVGIWA